MPAYEEPPVLPGGFFFAAGNDHSALASMGIFSGFAFLVLTGPRETDTMKRKQKQQKAL